MAASDAKPIPIKNTAYRVTFPILDADGDLVTAAGGLDSEVSKDAGTFTDCTNEATEIATSSGMYYLDLTATEMNADTVAVIVKSTGGKTTPIVMYPQEAGDIKVDVESISGDTVAADNAELMFDGTGYAGGTTKLQVDAVALSGDTIAADNAEAMFDGAGYAGGTIKLQVDTVAISGDTVAADNCEADYDGTGYNKSNSTIGTAAALTTNNDKTGYSISGTKTTLDALNDVSAADVNAQCDAAIETYNLDHLMAAAVLGTDVVDNSALAKLAALGATADWDTFDNTTDSLQAVRDRGDAAWITAVPPTAGAIADAVWDEATAGHTTGGTFGEQCATDVDAILADTADMQPKLGTPVSSVSADIAAVQADLPVKLVKNTAYSNFTFVMVDSTDHATPKTSLTVTAQRSIDGAAFGACANSVTEISNGWYKINLAASDLNGDNIALKFTAAGADQTDIAVITQAT